jgi:charged multivesicular body protein 1
LNRQAVKAGKDEQTEKSKLKKVRHSCFRGFAGILTFPKAIQQGHEDIAKIYAQNAIRKQNEKVNLLRLASRIDAVSSRVQTAVTMQRVSMNIGEVVKGMDIAMNAMDLEKVGRDEKRGLWLACADNRW